LKLWHGIGVSVVALATAACAASSEPGLDDAELQANIDAAVAATVTAIVANATSSGATAPPTPTITPTSTPTLIAPPAPAPTSTPTAVPPATLTPTPTPIPPPTLQIGRVRRYAAPVGLIVPVEDKSDERTVRIRITDVIGGERAAMLTAEARSYNLPAPAGREFLLTRLEVDYIRGRGDEKKHFDRFTISLVSRDGYMLERTLPLTADPPDPKFEASGYPGASVAGWVLWQIPTGVKGVVVRYAPYLFENRAAWLATKVPGRLSATVARVVHGDTWEVILADGSADTVRLTGVVSPEVRLEDPPFQYGIIASVACLDDWGRRAALHVRSQLEGQAVLLELDPQAGVRDSLGRLLAHAILDGRDFNASLVEHGYARVSTEVQSSRGGRYLAAQALAQKESSGLWQCMAR
jgi:endonuclease YncB( thermonuclease family)